ncbi:MAG: beta-galactosidase [Clostridia bacterium]|nr:beta-galactosidase [Clostridia bacterium]
MEIYRTEHPRPQLRRDSYICLNGEWDFAIDKSLSGKDRKLYCQRELGMKINVPFCPESELSGIGEKDFLGQVWYHKTVTVSRGDNRAILHFGACDYYTDVWVNGTPVGKHKGGYTPFEFDITDYVNDGDNDITVCAYDPVKNTDQPSGKQSMAYQPSGCMYTRTTGIWQTVWMEYVPHAYVTHLKMTPVIADSSLIVEVETVCGDGNVLTLTASKDGKPCGEKSITITGSKATAILKIDDLRLWSHDDPFLYDLTVTLGDDRVYSYFGMREITWTDGIIHINGNPVFQRLVLDQGFYPDGIYTAKTEDDLVRDIDLAMGLGFNGARLHQKIYEERFLYHCDRLGYLVWGEFPSWGADGNRAETWRNFLPEWLEELRRDYNHPAIIGWCPQNETRNSTNYDFTKMLADMTHAYDATRPFIETSGFTHIPELTDIVDAHDYENDPEKCHDNYARLANGEAVVFGREDKALRPTFNSEYGSLWCAVNDETHGHRLMITLSQALDTFRTTTTEMLKCPKMGGFCFTQLIDVEIEYNGIYTYWREPKFDPAVIREIVSQKAAIEE